MTPLLTQTPTLTPTLTTPPTPTPTLSRTQLTLPEPNPPSPGLHFRQKLLYLESLSINSLTALTKNPSLRTSPLTSILSTEHTLTSSFGLPRSSLGRIFNMFPQLLTTPPSHLLPILHFLSHDLSLTPPHVTRAVTRCPRLLISSVHSQLIPTLHFLTRYLGISPRNPHTPVLLVSSVEDTLLPKIQFLLHRSRFSQYEVVAMVQRSPALLTYSIENNLRPKLDYLVDEMGRDVREVKAFPQYFSFSLEKRIVPRHKLLVEHGWFSLSLRDMLSVSDGEFDVRLLQRRLRLIDRGLLL